ncbi:spliced mRNA and cell cycle regulated protein [Scheffersomyces xylosifermentans]|uniref:spliced mRNA and cell cycle regulated protein n=1 Tax=Scheffersomyces xylosifermentans TaxID=1304137 RepID=UPI00315DB560
MDDKEYLEEGFDPKSLKVTQLRGILNEYDVEYPSNAKKSQLVELFNESILPRSSELAKDYKAKVANSNDVGFIDVQTEVVETEKAKKEKKKRIVKTKKSTEFVPEGKQSPVNVPAIPEVEKNIAIQNDTPVKKEESLDIEDSPFTTENVFQSPKSPSSASKGKKRQSEGPTSKEKRIKSPVDVTSIPEDKTPRSKKTKDKVAIKSIFDDDDDDEILGISKSPVKASLTLPKVEKVEKLETPVADKKIKSPKPIEAATPKSSKKDLLFASDEKLEAPAVKQSSKEKPSKVVKATPKKNTPIKTDKSPKSPVSSVKAATPRSSKKSQSTRSKSSKVDLSLNSNNSFKSVQEEVDDFDQELQRIKNTAPPSIDMQLAQELGISVQGIPSPFAKSPAISTPKQNVARTTSAITPKPRLVPINQAISELSEEDDDEEEEVDDDAEIEKIDQKITKIEQELDEENAIKKVKTAPHPKLGPLFLTFLTWIILVSAGLFGYWYREQTFLIGYCGEEINKPTFPDTDNKVLKTVGNYLDENLKPVCVPCPSHARCFPNLELGCFEDFVELRPWDNFIKPYNKKCIPDTKKAEKLEIMIDVALDLLRSKNAQTQCGQSSNNEEAGIKLDDLHDLLLSMKAPYITIEEFEELWERSILELEKEPEVIVRRDIQVYHPRGSLLTLTTSSKDRKRTRFFDQRPYQTLALNVNFTTF